LICDLQFQITQLVHGRAFDEYFSPTPLWNVGTIICDKANITGRQKSGYAVRESAVVRVEAADYGQLQVTAD
jgi:hypothetical protein